LKTIVLPDKTVPLPEPWFWTDIDFTDQLRKEISLFHVLFFKRTKSIAKREDCDDVLFALRNNKYAVVHLTWQNQSHSDTRWPETRIYKSWQDLFENCILVDNEEQRMND
jgi:hypothetical protein